MDVNNRNNTGSILYYFIFSIFLIFVSFSIVVNHFTLINSDVYRTIIYGFTIFNVIAYLILSIIEAVSLTFDRTANKNTLYITVLLLLSLLTREEFVHAINVFANLDSQSLTVVNDLFVVLNNAFYLLTAFFFFRFARETFNLKVRLFEIGISLLIIEIGFTIFYYFRISIGSLILAIIESLSVLGVALYFTVKSKNNINFKTILTTFFIILYLSASLLMNYLSIETIFNISLYGISALFFVVIVFLYIYIYFIFIVAKANESYASEDEKRQKELILSRKMTVSCFQTFDCNIGDLHLSFPSKKCKEFFALLVVLRGKTLTMEKAITYLWPDKDIDKAKVSYRDVIWKLRKYLIDINYPSVTFKRGETTLDAKNVECDYYDVIDGKKEYTGEPLMPEYEWSIEFESNL